MGLDKHEEIAVVDMGKARPRAQTALLGRVGRLLKEAYSMFDWYVDITADGSMVIVKNIDFYAEHQRIEREGNGRLIDFGFMLPLSKLQYEDEFKRNVLLAGGELLERAYVNLSSGERTADKVDTEQVN